MAIFATFQNLVIFRIGVFLAAFCVEQLCGSRMVVFVFYGTLRLSPEWDELKVAVFLFYFYFEVVDMIRLSSRDMLQIKKWLHSSVG